MAEGEWFHQALSSEYLRLQESIEEFDGKALTIKAWSVTLSAAGIVAAYTEEKPIVLLVASASALVFWVVEALWKTNQQAFYERVYEIENYYAGKLDQITPFKIATRWSQSWHRHGKDRNAFRVMRWSHVYLPHLIVAVAAAALFFIAPPVPTPA